MSKYIKIDNAYINTAFITSVTVERVGCENSCGKWVMEKQVIIRTVDGNSFYFNGTIDDAIELIRKVKEE